MIACARVWSGSAAAAAQDLLKQVLQLPDAQLVAIADIESRRRDEAKQMVPGIQTFDADRWLLAMKDIDGVIVATPVFLHCEHLFGALVFPRSAWEGPALPPMIQASRRSVFLH
jgi:predicted dehydrogenase